MFEPSKLSDFKFTLDDLNKYQVTMPYNEYLLTIDNYQSKMNTQFPSLHYVAPPVQPEVDEPDQNTGENTEEPPLDEPATDTDVPAEPEQGGESEYLPSDSENNETDNSTDFEENPISDEPEGNDLPLDPGV